MSSLYDFPAVYDVVMARPPGVVEAEAATVVSLLARHGIAAGRVLELACGASAHGLLLARAGYQVTGLDRAPAMLAEAGRRAAACGVDLALATGDVVDFDLRARPFDAAIFMYETFPVIADEADIRRHFAAVRRRLRPGGVYLFDVDRCHGIRGEGGEWGRRTLPLPSGAVEVWHEDWPGDWVTGVNRLTLHCRIEIDSAVTHTRDDWVIRCYTPWELALLIRTLEGWELDGFYAWRDGSPDIAGEAHYFTAAIAR